jgi:hypothetical protein
MADKGKSKSGIIDRFLAQTVSAYIHRDLSGPNNRICHCLRSQTDRSQVIDLMKSPGSDKAHYKGLQTCGSIHVCPLCASKITEHRKNEIQEIIEKTSHKYHYLITLTFPHTHYDFCYDSRVKFMDARRRMKRWAAVKDHPEFVPFSQILEHHQYDGSVTTVEVTYGVNGWHIHSHELFIFDKPVEDLRKFRQDVYANWTKACLYSGIEITKPLAFHRRSVQIDHLCGDHVQKMTSYLTKIANSDTWGLSAEMTKGIVKKSQNGNITPFGMLHEIAQASGDIKKSIYKKWAPLFFEYAQTFKGKQAIRFSKGLKAKYGLEDLTDEEVVNAEDLLSQMYGFFEKSEWQTIRRLRLRGWIIEKSGQSWNQLVESLNIEIKKRKEACNDKKTGKALLTETG